MFVLEKMNINSIEKKSRKDELHDDDEKFVLDFFKRKFDCATSFDKVIKTDVKDFRQSFFSFKAL